MTTHKTNYHQLPLDPLGKGMGKFSTASTASPVDVKELGWNVLREDVSFPTAVLSEAHMQLNLTWIQEFVNQYQVKLAPHGKTTMAPKLFARQLAGGAFGVLP